MGGSRWTFETIIATVTMVTASGRSRVTMVTVEHKQPFLAQLGWRRSTSRDHVSALLLTGSVGTAFRLSLCETQLGSHCLEGHSIDKMTKAHGDSTSCFLQRTWDSNLGAQGSTSYSTEMRAEILCKAWFWEEGTNPSGDGG